MRDDHSSSSHEQYQHYLSQRLENTTLHTGLDPEIAARDWRFGRVRIASFDMDETQQQQQQHQQQNADATAEEGSASDEHKPTPAASLGPVLGGAGQATRGRFNPLATKVTDAGWGIVHLYREGGPTYVIPEDGDGDNGGDGRDGTILCIPAVPSYMTPRDFLGFVGETWNRDVSHYRMVMTSRTNRYMVLLKFRDSRRARAWRTAFDGRVFNSMEAEICHVAFIKSITIETPDSVQQHHHHHPPSQDKNVEHTASASSLRPLPPPTANLIELPTCPVCLERMDDTAGIMTILCQHVFHCTCLQTWKGSGCPVCRATNPSPMTSAADGSNAGETGSSAAAGGAASGSMAYDPDNPLARPFGAGAVSNLCSVCDCPDDLWICLICGNVGCGRYKGGHAKEHWKETLHSFSLEIETQHVWDYAGDMWVHRLIRDKGDGKVVELPGRRSRGQHPRRRRNHQGEGTPDYDEDDSDDSDDNEEEDVVPRAKLDHIGLEYTHLLTSQLESQRVYFEEMVNKAADKAAKAAAAAEAASAQTAEAMHELGALRAAHTTLAETTVPSLERDLERERRRADRAAELARELGKSLQNEKRVSEGLLARIHHVQEKLTATEHQLIGAQTEVADLRDINRDLTMFISGGEKLRELEAAGQIEAGEVTEGTASVPEEKKGKGKGKGRRR